MPLVVRLLALLTGVTGAAAVVTTLITLFNAITSSNGLGQVGTSVWILSAILLGSAVAVVMMSLAMGRGGSGFRYLLNLLFGVIAIAAIWIAFTVGEDYADPAAIITAILALGALTLMNVANSTRAFFHPAPHR